MHICIILAGSLQKGEYLTSFLEEKIDYIIAVDGGFSYCLDLGLTPNLIIGDFDSLPEDHFKIAKDLGVTIEKHPKEKDFTDSELAFDFAIKKGATFISLLGALGGKRSDHFLANIFLFHQFYKKVPFIIIDGNQKILFLEPQKELILQGKVGDYISIIPFCCSLSNITSEGLYYPLNNSPILIGRSLGLSNEFIKEKASILIEKGEALIIQLKRLIT